MRPTRFSAFAPFVGALVAVVLAGGVFAAAGVEGGETPVAGSVRVAGDNADGLAADAPETTTTSVPLPPPAPTTSSTGRPLASSPATSSQPTTTVTTSRPPATPTSRPAPRRSSALGGSTRADLGPIDPAGVEVPFSPGQTSWTGVSAGVTVTVRIDSAAPKAGTPAT